LTGEFLQALLAICFLTFTLWGSHEQVRLAASQPTSLARKCCAARCAQRRLKSQWPRADTIGERADINDDNDEQARARK
jgi:hypothetical protein